MNNIRNFCIIAHIDHGKSTLSDRFLQLTGVLGDASGQVLDDMELEQERGITIKSKAVRMTYTYQGQEYVLNLIDTPGHVDFSYEVSRSLNSCEAAILLVDAAQGVEAQTMSNLYLALENDLEIIPVINKIDLPSANVPACEEKLIELLSQDNIYKVSAKSNIGIQELLEGIIRDVPPPKGDEKQPVKALVFDSFYDKYRGVVIVVRVFDGTLKKGDKVKFWSNDYEFVVEELGYAGLGLKPGKTLKAGDVGYIISGIKDIEDAKVGDTVTGVSKPCAVALAGFQEVKPMVYSGVFPVASDEYKELRDALEKLKLNDASLVYEPENSLALGFGFRCGFLGMLHLEIVVERLYREYDVAIITTAPSVPFRVFDKSGQMVEVHNPINLPEQKNIDHIQEPYMNLEIIVPSRYIGNIMKLVIDKRGIQKNMEYIDEERVCLHYDIPLLELIFDFYSRLKSVSSGYASMDYSYADYRTSDIVKVDILVNGDKVDAMSFMAHRDKARSWGLNITDKLKDLIPRHLFKIPIQAAIGSDVIARSTITAMRKNVTAKCYGGDITRKRKLLEKQKKGKKRMKEIGSVSIPQEAFLAVMKADKA